MIQIAAVGGYGEVGRNCTAVNVNGAVVLIDLGLHLDHYIKYTEDEEEEVHDVSPKALMQAGAIPDLGSIKDWEKNIEAIVLGHAHLDHIGAVPFLAKKFSGVPIYGSAFTIAVLRELLRDKDITLDQDLHVIPAHKRTKIAPGVELEFFPITHSTPDTMLTVLHTPEGAVVYANDFKLDNHPTLGKPVEIKPLEGLKTRVLALICECLNAPEAAKTPSESVARELLREVLLETKTTKKAIFVTTFSSHIARLQSIVEVAKALDRKPVFLGRSLAKYLYAAKDAGIVDLTKEAMVVKYSSHVKRFLKSVDRPYKYLFIGTGHQGEPKAILSKIVDEGLFKFAPEDIIVFSCNVIPVAQIEANRKHLEEKLRKLHLRVYTDVHVSGHASREDLREFVSLIEPKYIIPSHGDPIMTKAFVELVQEHGYANDRIVSLREGGRFTVDTSDKKA
jgi:ribonuclease J